MLKAILICISICVGYFTSIFFSRYINYKVESSLWKDDYDSVPLYSDRNGSTNLTNYNETHPILRSLTELIKTPLIGQFFM